MSIYSIELLSKYYLKLYSLKTYLNNEINEKLIKREGKIYSIY